MGTRINRTRSTRQKNVERESLKQEAGGRLLIALRLILVVFAAAALVMGASSCDMLDKLPFIGKKAEVKRPRTRRRVKKKKKVKKKAVEAMKVAKVKPVYVYQPKGKVDPFLPFLKGYAKPKVRVRPKIPPTPLQKFDLTDFRLVAVVWGAFGRKAMIQDRAGKGYIVTQGTLIGRNNGRIKNILKDKLVVEEEREDALGNIIKIPVELRLPKTPKEILEAGGLARAPAPGEESAEEGEAEKVASEKEPGASQPPSVEIPTPEEE